MSDVETKDRTRIGGYELIMQLAAGGMATIHVARQAAAGVVERFVVVKRVHPHLLGLSGFAEMFRDEARVAALIRHPNIVPMLDVVETEGELCLVFDYVESVSLAQLSRIARERGICLPPPIVARIVSDVLAGLHAAHEATGLSGDPLGVVHRDVTPHNILVGLDGASRLIDFGIAKAASRLKDTTGGAIKGKAAYMSPEQARGDAVDRRSDIFSAGIVLHELLTGQPLFHGDDVEESAALLAVLLAPIDPPSTLAPSTPPALDDVVLRALARPRAERFETAASFAEAIESVVTPASVHEVSRVVDALAGEHIAELRDHLRTATAAHSSSVVSPRQKSRGSRRRRIASWIAVAAGLVLAAAAFAIQRASKATSPQSAESSTPSASLISDVPRAASPSSAPDGPPEIVDAGNGRPRIPWRGPRRPPRPAAASSQSPLHPNPYPTSP
jgi:serine/threonine-protein kinase